jgi:alpha-beta hydrolase superfamily lysophospholipase
MMAELGTLLAPDFTVYIYDRRGRGASCDSPHYAVEREIEDLNSLILEAGGSACVLSISTGAVLALEAAACGLGMARLALYEPPFTIDDMRPAVPENYPEQLTELIGSGRRGGAV